MSIDPNNLGGEYGRSDLDLRNRFVGTLLWKPTILSSNPWMKHGLDGFTFSGTATGTLTPRLELRRRRLTSAPAPRLRAGAA